MNRIRAMIITLAMLLTSLDTFAASDVYRLHVDRSRAVHSSTPSQMRGERLSKERRDDFQSRPSLATQTSFAVRTCRPSEFYLKGS